MQGHRRHHRRLDRLVGLHPRTQISVILAWIGVDVLGRISALEVLNKKITWTEMAEKEVRDRGQAGQRLRLKTLEIKGLLLLIWAQGRNQEEHRYGHTQSCS
ncbi:alcohol dehydrogenase [Sesbania bispinosa]|nr:alcohol dehydrogenase [Sesbania bispinosa]